MAYIKKLASGNFQAQIRLKGLQPICKTFSSKALATQFVRQVEGDTELQRKLGLPACKSLAFSELVDQYLAQTTFREATRDFSRYQYQGQGSLLRWLVQILQNKIRDKAEFYSAGKRDLSKERAMDAGASDGGEAPTPMEFVSSDLSVTKVVQRDENFELLRESLTELSPEHRKAISLVFFEGLPLRQAGERMGGKSEDAVRMMLRRAESKLGEKLRSTLGDD